MNPKFIGIALVFCSLQTQLTKAQLDSTKLDSNTIDSLINTYIEDYNPFGCVFFKDSALYTGQMLMLYKSYLVDT